MVEDYVFPECFVHSEGTAEVDLDPPSRGVLVLFHCPCYCRREILRRAVGHGWDRDLFCLAVGHGWDRDLFYWMVVDFDFGQEAGDLETERDFDPVAVVYWVSE